jgi:hypothetical protein
MPTCSVGIADRPNASPHSARRPPRVTTLTTFVAFTGHHTRTRPQTREDRAQYVPQPPRPVRAGLNALHAPPPQIAPEATRSVENSRDRDAGDSSPWSDRITQQPQSRRLQRGDLRRVSQHRSPHRSHADAGVVTCARLRAADHHTRRAWRVMVEIGPRGTRVGPRLKGLPAGTAQSSAGGHSSDACWRARPRSYWRAQLGCLPAGTAQVLLAGTARMPAGGHGPGPTGGHDSDAYRRHGSVSGPRESGWRSARGWCSRPCREPVTRRPSPSERSCADRH